MFTLTNISLFLFVTTAINFGATYVSWKRRETHSGRYFSWALLSIAMWTLFVGLDYAAVPVHLKVNFARLEYLCSNTGLVMFMLFTLSYAGYGDWINDRWRRAALVAIPVSNVLLAFTNPWHQLLWSAFTPTDVGENIVIFEHGPAFNWVVANNYLYIGAIIVLLFRVMRSSSALTRRQARLLIAGTVIPVIGNLIYLLEFPGLEGIDWTSILFSGAGVIYLIALQSTRLLDLVPIARHTVIEWLVDGVLVLNNRNQVVDVNQAMQTAFGLGRDCIGESVERVFASWPAIVRFLQDESAEGRHLEVILWEQDAIRQVFDTHVIRLENDSGRVYGKLVSFRNVTERHLAEQKLQQRFREIDALHQQVKWLAERDSLTNAYTRRYLHDYFDSLDADSPLARRYVVVLLDIDDFKEVNDRYGHTTGDEMLKALVEILDAHSGADDLVCRFGGDEFVIVVAGAAIDEVVARMQVVRDLFARVRLAGMQRGTSISIGVSEYPRHSRDYEELINMADRAMYTAKQAGGNRVELFSPG